MLKPKKGFLMSQLNIEKLTPLQFDGILRAMDAYAEHYHEISKMSKTWKSLAESVPSVDKHGSHVLLYRYTNESQKAMAVTVHDTNMVRFCNPNETWWMEIEQPPAIEFLSNDFY